MSHPCYTLTDSASWCLFPCVDLLWKTYFTLRYIDKCTECFMIFTYTLINPNSHLSRNVIQCNPPRKNRCRNWQRQYKMLRSNNDYCCIRWCLQEQYYITDLWKNQSVNITHTWLFHYIMVGSVAPELRQNESFEMIIKFTEYKIHWKSESRSMGENDPAFVGEVNLSQTMIHNTFPDSESWCIVALHAPSLNNMLCITSISTNSLNVLWYSVYVW